MELSPGPAIRSRPERFRASSVRRTTYRRSAGPARRLGDPGIWDLHDLNPSSQFPSGEAEGLYDVNGNIKLAGQIYLYRGQNNDQPINSAIDTTNTYRGNPSILLTGSNKTISGETQPALETDPVTAPIPAAGQPYTFGIYLKASGFNGTPALVASWYGSNGSYISGTNGPHLTLTGTFTQYSLQTVAPAGALYAKLFLQVGHNAGSIWVANATWA